MSADTLSLPDKNSTAFLPYLVISFSGVGLYMPFASRFLYHEDSVGFALAIHHFDIRMHEPHAPGYPLYVLALRAVHFVTGAADNTCMIIVGIAATILSAVLLYVFALSWMKRFEALTLSLVVMSSPVVWFNAEVALSYPVGMLGSIAVALTCLRFMNGSAVARCLLPIVWGLSAGFRPDVAVMLLPLVIYACRYEILKKRAHIVLMLALATAAVTTWLAPLIWISGGLRQYFGTVAATAANVSPVRYFRAGEISSGVELTFKNITITAVFLGVSTLGLIPLQAIRLSRGLVRRSPDRAYTNRLTFLAVWATPGIVLHAFTTIGHSGYVLPYIPPFLLSLSAPFWGADISTGVESSSIFRLKHVLLGMGIAFQAGFFLLFPQRSGALDRDWVSDTVWRAAASEPTLSHIKRCDATVEHLVAQIKLSYPPETTILIVPVGDALPRDRPMRGMFAQGRYYLPEWEQRVLYTVPLDIFKRIGWKGWVIATVYKDKFELVNTNMVNIPRHIRWLVWFFDADSSPYPFDSSWVRYSVGSGVDLVVGDIKAVPALRWGPFEFTSSAEDVKTPVFDGTITRRSK